MTKQLVELQNANIQPADLAPDQETGIIKRALASQAGGGRASQSTVFTDKMTVLYEIYRRFEAAVTTHVTAPDPVSDALKPPRSRRPINDPRLP